MQILLYFVILFLYIRGCCYKYGMLVLSAMISQEEVSYDDETIRKNAAKIVKEHWYEILF